MNARLRLVLLAVAVVAAAVSVNLVLLGYVGGGHEQVGNLTPVTPALVPPATATVTMTTTAPARPHEPQDD